MISKFEYKVDTKNAQNKYTSDDISKRETKREQLVAKRRQKAMIYKDILTKQNKERPMWKRTMKM